MNTSHYPSPDLCKKLTEIGFPNTTLAWIGGHSGFEYEIDYMFGNETVWPSPMDMLDYMRENKISIMENGVIDFLSPELPDSLAENILAYNNRIGHLNN